jgi:ankyrin repeat protein
MVAHWKDDTKMLDKIADGRTDLVFDYVAGGGAANSADSGGVSLLQWCAYYGDVSAIRFLLAGGETLSALGENFDLAGAAFHGHWQLCQFLIERGADVNHAGDTGESPLHAALCKANRPVYDEVVKVLLANGANPNAATRPGVETDSFMRDCRTKGETPLHRAAAFGSEVAIDLLLDAGARRDAKDINGDSPCPGRAGIYARTRCFGSCVTTASRSTRADGPPTITVSGGR